MLHQSNIFAVALIMQILLVLPVVPNIYQKLDSVMCIFFEYEHLKSFVWKDDNIFKH